jgi:hypothetical protein
MKKREMLKLGFLIVTSSSALFSKVAIAKDKHLPKQ